MARFNAVTGRMEEDELGFEPESVSQDNVQRLEPMEIRPSWLAASEARQASHPEEFRTDEQQAEIENGAAPFEALSRLAGGARRVGEIAQQVVDPHGAGLTTFAVNRLRGVENDPYSAIEEPLSMATGAASSATLGGVDHWIAGSQATVDSAMGEGVDFDVNYNRHLDRQRDARRYTENAAPTSNLVGRIGGGLASPSLSGSAAASGLSNVGRHALSFGESVLGSGLQADAEGGSFGEGAALGGATALGIKGAQALGRLPRFIRGRRIASAQARAADLDRVALGSGGGTGEDISSMAAMAHPPPATSGLSDVAAGATPEETSMRRAAEILRRNQVLPEGPMATQDVANQAVGVRDAMRGRLQGVRGQVDELGDEALIRRTELLNRLRRYRSGMPLSSTIDDVRAVDSAIRTVERPPAGAGTPGVTAAERESLANTVRQGLEREGSRVSPDSKVFLDINRLMQESVADDIERNLGQQARQAFDADRYQYGVVDRYAQSAEKTRNTNAAERVRDMSQTSPMDPTAAIPGATGRIVRTGKNIVTMTPSEAVTQNAPVDRYLRAQQARVTLDRLLKTQSMRPWADSLSNQSPMARAASNLVLSRSSQQYRESQRQAEEELENQGETTEDDLGFESSGPMQNEDDLGFEPM